MGYTSITYRDMQDAIDSANNLLDDYGKGIELRILHQHGLFGISTFNFKTSETTNIVKPVNIDCCYNWLAGFNTAIMNEYFSNTIDIDVKQKPSLFKRLLDYLNL